MTVRICSVFFLPLYMTNRNLKNDSRDETKSKFQFLWTAYLGPVGLGHLGNLVGQLGQVKGVGDGGGGEESGEFHFSLFVVI